MQGIGKALSEMFVGLMIAVIVLLTLVVIGFGMLSAFAPWLWMQIVAGIIALVFGVIAVVILVVIIIKG